MTDLGTGCFHKKPKCSYQQKKTRFAGVMAWTVLGKALVLQASGAWFRFPRTHIKSLVLQCMHIIPALGRQKQEDP